jgi:hypothetical protein
MSDLNNENKKPPHKIALCFGLGCEPLCCSHAAAWTHFSGTYMSFKVYLYLQDNNSIIWLMINWFYIPAKREMKKTVNLSWCFNLIWQEEETFTEKFKKSHHDDHNDLVANSKSHAKQQFYNLFFLWIL